MEPTAPPPLERRLAEVLARFHELEQRLGEPAVAADPARYRELAKQHAGLAPLVETWSRLREARSRLAQADEMLATERDPELRGMAEAERSETSGVIPELQRRLQLLLVPRDPHDDKNAILEIRAGTGGEEAALFAADLFRMYGRHAERRGWRLELIQATESANGGYREIIASISGDEVYARLKFESGVHRVQRIPATEAQGRIHTSAATVAVLPEAEEVDVALHPADLRIDVFRSSGPGGQSVNTTDSAVRVTHVPSGLVVQCQDEKSQHKNKAKAIQVLRARLFDLELRRQAAERAASRRSMVGSGDRSERIRTYNFPQNRLTDHRINLTLYKLDKIIEGDLDELVEALILEERSSRLEASVG